MILVSEAGWRGLSALVACITAPELASTTIDEEEGSYFSAVGAWMRCQWRRPRASASVVMAATASSVAKPRALQRRPRWTEAPARNIRSPQPHFQADLDPPNQAVL